MADETHFRKLEHMYAAAPINQTVHSRIRVEHGRAEVRIRVVPELFHSAHSLHGSIYFKALDDAAFFAANSVVTDAFVLTARFEVNLLAVVTGAEIRGVGTFIERDGRKLEASAELFDDDEVLVARGHGLFIASKMPLASVPSYTLPTSRALDD